MCNDTTTSYQQHETQTIHVLTQRNKSKLIERLKTAHGPSRDVRGVHTSTSKQGEGERPRDSLILLKAGVNGDRWEVAFDLTEAILTGRTAKSRKAPASSLSKAMALCTDLTKITTFQLCLNLLRALRSAGNQHSIMTKRGPQ